MRFFCGGEQYTEYTGQWIMRYLEMKSVVERESEENDYAVKRAKMRPGSISSNNYAVKRTKMRPGSISGK